VVLCVFTAVSEEREDGSNDFLRNFCKFLPGCAESQPISEIATHHVTRHNTPIHNIMLTAPQLSISPKALGKLPEDGNVMPKHVGDTIHY
jgi:hypothetical protein